MSIPIPMHLKALPHGIDITAPGGVDELLAFHRARFGDAQMNAESQQSSGEAGGEKKPRTFTQDELNAILAEDRRKNAEKYADYDDLKAKAEQLDQHQQENQTELEKAVARAEKAERERDQERTDRQLADRRALAAEVASAKGVPVSHISGDTREDLEKSADALISWRSGGQEATGKQQEQPPNVGGYVPHSGTGENGPTPASMASGRDRAAAKHTTKN